MDIVKWAEAMLAGTLTKEASQELEDRLASDPAFAAAFNEQLELLQSLERVGQNRQFRALLRDVHQDRTPTVKKGRSIPFLRSQFSRMAALAAGVAMITSLITIWVLQSNTVVRKTSSYHTLVNIQKDIARIKNAQYQQNLTINQIRDTLERMGPDAQVSSSGTAFALTNNGYLVTNYHVVNGADSVYIRTREGRYYKTYTVAYDETTDIALLKVEKEHFRFGKGEVPYHFAPAKSPLGARIFTLGFPQDEIVYNEGYVSARNGFRGNTDQYRLDLPVNPGQSGAPVLDAQGNLIGIVTAHETDRTDITYAVSTNALHALLASLPGQLDIHLPRYSRLSKLPREQQIEKLQDYTCLVQVYK